MRNSHAVRKADAKSTRQAVKRSTHNQRHQGELVSAGMPLSWHHVFRHSLLSEHIHGDEHSRALARAVVEESHNSSVIQVLAPNMVPI